VISGALLEPFPVWHDIYNTSLVRKCCIAILGIFMAVLAIVLELGRQLVWCDVKQSKNSYLPISSGSTCWLNLCKPRYIGLYPSLIK